jgi:hypothetical protein
MAEEAYQALTAASALILDATATMEPRPFLAAVATQS